MKAMVASLLAFSPAALGAATVCDVRGARRRARGPGARSPLVKPENHMTKPRSTRWVFVLVLLTLAAGPRRGTAFQAPQAAGGGGSAPLTAEQDHQRVMDLLHIASLRPGANQREPQGPNGVNWDESKANPYPNLPDPLTLNSGKKVKTAKQWWQKRRPEVVEFFDREIYGRGPKNPPKVKWEVTATTNGTNGDVPVVTKQLVGHVDNSAYPQLSVNIQVTLTTPANATGAVPVMLLIGGGAPPAGRAGASPAGAGGPGRGEPAGPSAQQLILAKGWGYASFAATSFQADNGAGLQQGIIGLVNKGQPRKLDDWGTLRAWAWGASRALDYFETDKSVDARHVGVEGHSRWGKTAVVAMAYDARFAVAYNSSSGEAGTKIHRRNWGELVENIADTKEYYWMAGNFLKYAGPLHWNDMPVDAHELIALCAPRPVFSGAGTLAGGDGWADATGMFQAAVGAGPVYKLLGAKDLGTGELPPVGTALVDGDVAFREHPGGHTDLPNWPTFLAFADRYMKAPRQASSHR